MFVSGLWFWNTDGLEQCHLKLTYKPKNIPPGGMLVWAMSTIRQALPDFVCPLQRKYPHISFEPTLPTRKICHTLITDSHWHAYVIWKREKYNWCCSTVQGAQFDKNPNKSPRLKTGNHKNRSVSRMLCTFHVCQGNLTKRTLRTLTAATDVSLHKEIMINSTWCQLQSLSIKER